MTERKAAVILTAAEIAAGEQQFSHPWNPRSEIRGMRLAMAAGLARTGLGLARIAPGRESFVPHAHRYEEEWLYILSGKAVVTIDGVDHPVAAGDFIAFPTPSAVHHLRNESDADVVYLMGGESRPFDIADFPEHGRIGFKIDGGFFVAEAGALQPMFGPPPGEAKGG
jgi:uncharacterized cupin superfamily protein